MPLRLLEIYHPYLEKETLEEFLKSTEVLGIWQDRLDDDTLFTRIVVRHEHTDDVIETLKAHFTKPEQLRIVILPVEACFPRRDAWEEAAREETDQFIPGLRRRPPSRTSINELVDDAIEMGGISLTYIVMSILAAIVAAIGILLDDVAIIIGSMVIAPLLSPNITLTLAVTLADWKLGKLALYTSLVGYLISLGIGVLFGAFLDVDTESPQMIARTDFSLLFVVVALAAGVAGALTFTKGASEALVGVMVAVALLPPLVAGGLLMGSEHWAEALGAMLLFAVNVLSIKLAGALTFVAQGVTPYNWLEKEQAKRTTVMGITIWLCLLVLVVVMILLYQRYILF
jgi:uncharacterized hydrophobic protein (TIGR00341 family)